MGLNLWVLFGNTFSQITIHHFEALQLSFTNISKLRTSLQKWVEESYNKENLQEIYNAKTLLHAWKGKKTSMENPVRGNLESMFL